MLPLTPVAGEEAGRHRDLEAVTRQELLSGRAVSPSRVLLSSLSSLVSLEMRGDLETGLCGGPGGARGLCFSLVLLWCPEDKGEKKKVFEELQMLCERCQAENPGSCSNSSSEKLLFSLPFLFEG